MDLGKCSEDAEGQRSGFPRTTAPLCPLSQPSLTLPPSPTHLCPHQGPGPFSCYLCHTHTHTDACIHRYQCHRHLPLPYTHAFLAFPAARAPGTAAVIGVVTGVQLAVSLSPGSSASEKKRSGLKSWREAGQGEQTLKRGLKRTKMKRQREQIYLQWQGFLLLPLINFCSLTESTSHPAPHPQEGTGISHLLHNCLCQLSDEASHEVSLVSCNLVWAVITSEPPTIQTEMHRSHHINHIFAPSWPGVSTQVLKSS